jgi:hypothetical protein
MVLNMIIRINIAFSVFQIYLNSHQEITKKKTCINNSNVHPGGMDTENVVSSCCILKFWSMRALIIQWWSHKIVSPSDIIAILVYTYSYHDCMTKLPVNIILSTYLNC